VRVVKTKDWNASAMANGAVWVYTGLMDAMDDDELSIVMGHELAHYSYEHIRRNQSRAGLWLHPGAGARWPARRHRGHRRRPHPDRRPARRLGAAVRDYSRE
jgi:hypothetical protein